MSKAVIDTEWLDSQIRFLELAAKKTELSVKDAALLEYIKNLKAQLSPIKEHIVNAYIAGQTSGKKGWMDINYGLSNYLKQNGYE